MRILEARAAKLRAEMEAGRGGDTIFAFPVPLEPPLAPSARSSGRHQVGLWSPLGETPQRAEPLRLSFLRVRPSVEDEFSGDLSQQLLVAFSPQQPLAFEIVGLRGTSSIQIAALPSDIEAVSRQLAAHFPRTELTPAQDLLRDVDEGLSCARSYRLRCSHIFPAKRAHAVDPYLALLGLLAGLGKEESALLQVLLAPVGRDWRGNILEMSRDEWDPTKSPFVDLPHLPKMADQKVATGLFAVVMRLAASNRYLLDRLEGSFLSQFDGEDNGFVPLTRAYPLESILNRTSHHHGMILNAAELAGLAHLPNPSQVPQSLERAKTTAAPPPVATRNILVALGINRHHGVSTPVGIPGDWLTRHVAEFGGTGYGKTTSFKAFFVSIIEHGYGLAFLDPAGDAAEEFLDLVPRQRVDDVIYFNPGDRDWPPALNVLESSERDQEMLAAELMVSLKRLFRRSAEFGPRMEWILRQALLALLASEGEKTLRDVPRLLADENYREDVLRTVADPDLLWFWRSRAPFPASVIDPILNRLSAFLDRPTIRNIVAQSNLIDFHRILREGNILICNLSKGILGEEHSSLQGSFILSKLQLATMARAELPPQERRLFVIIVDELQNYAGSGSDTASIRSSLSEARKYGVAMVTATQFTAQLGREVLTAIFGNVGTLMCLRSGVADAQVLQRELGLFAADDLLNLETGQALVRMGRAASAFNVDIVPPAIPERSYRDEIIDLSRQKYCRPRIEVEAAVFSSSEKPEVQGSPRPILEPGELAFLQRIARHPEETVTAACRASHLSGSGAARVRRRLRERGLIAEVDTRLGRKGRRARFAVPTFEGFEAVAERPHGGRGGPIHQHFVEIIARYASEKGYQVAKEHRLSGGWVDLHLEREGQATAVEVSISSTSDRELSNLQKCLKAGYHRVLVLFLDEAVWEAFDDVLPKTLPQDQCTKVEAGKLKEFHRLL